MRYGVYFEYSSDYTLRFGEDGTFFADAGVVNQHGWIAVVRADEGGGLVDAGGGRDVAFVEVYIFCLISISQHVTLGGEGKREYGEKQQAR